MIFSDIFNKIFYLSDRIILVIITNLLISCIFRNSKETIVVENCVIFVHEKIRKLNEKAREPKINFELIFRAFESRDLFI